MSEVESSPQSPAYRQLLHYLADMRRSGVTHLPACELKLDSLISSPRSLVGDSKGNPAAGAAETSPSDQRVLQSGEVDTSKPRINEPPRQPTVDPAPRPILPLDGNQTRLRELDEHSDSDRTVLLQQLSDEAAACFKCSELVENRTQTVFGVGNIRPRLCFFGEGPGADEDRLGEPFVGRAGQLLDKIIQAMTLERSDVYILNSVKCRPPRNRNPEPNEISHCQSFWIRQLEILQPEFICCLGAVAAKTLLGRADPVGRLRGQWFDYRGAGVIVTYHPAYLLRNEFAKRYVWDDIKMLMKEMGLSRPQS